MDCHVEIEKKYSNRKDRFQWRPFRLFCFCEEQSEFEIRFCFQMVGIAFGHSEVVACPERVIRSPAVKNRFSIQREEESVIGGRRVREESFRRKGKSQRTAHLRCQSVRG